MGFAGADDFGEQRAAGLHQNKNITSMNWARTVAGDDLRTFGQKAADFGCNLIGQLGHGMAGADQIDGVFKGRFFLHLVCFDPVPQIDPPRQIRKTGAMGHFGAQGFGRQIGQGRVDHVENGGRGAERIKQRAVLKHLLGGGEFAVEVVLIFIKGRNIRALKGIDRLLLIAHHKQGPPTRTRPLARGEFVCQMFDHLPLLGRSILRLVYQHMVDAAIQPKQHPCGNRWVRQQAFGAGDQIVKIKQALGGFALGIKRQEGVGKGINRLAHGCSSQGQAARAEKFDTLHQGIQARYQVGDGFARGGRGERGEFGRIGIFCFLPRQKNIL